MKFRTDYVTNSSSSSFILAFKDKEDGLSQIAAMTHQFGIDYVEQLLVDFSNAAPIAFDEIKAHCSRDLESDASFSISFGRGSWWSSEKKTFENKWRLEHPDASYSDFYRSKEYRDELLRRTDEYATELIERIGDRRYLVELEYEDHTDVGSALEHDILPDCDFTVKRFSHH